MNKFKRRWFPKKPLCEGGRGFATVGLQEVKPALILLFIANGVALILMFMEICIHKAMISYNHTKVPLRLASMHSKFKEKYQHGKNMHMKSLRH